MRKLRIGVVGLPGKWSTETLADAVAVRTGFRLVIDMNKVTLNLATQELHYQGVNLCQLDAIIIKKICSHYSPNTLDRLELLRVAENAGVAVFSRPTHILRLIDRLSCTVTLRNAGIPMPATRVTEDIDEALSIIQEFGSAIFKPLYSTKARGMCVINCDDGRRAMRRAVEQFKTDNPMMYIQQRVALGGQDMGLVFLDGHYLGAYARIGNNKTWNTTIHNGGSYASIEPSRDIIQLAHQAQSLFKMSYTTVDVAETDNGTVIFEVSAFGGFRGAKEGMNLDAAQLYTDHVIDRISN